MALKIIQIIFFLTLFPALVFSQDLKSVSFQTGQGLAANGLITSDSISIVLKTPRPVLAFNIDDITFSTLQAETIIADTGFLQIFENGINVSLKPSGDFQSGWKCEVTFRNKGGDTVSLSNVIPFGSAGSTAYITGDGPWDLARAYLFRPGFRPLRVILPDNAWEMGYVSFDAGNSSVCAIARRQMTTGQKKRYETLLPPGTYVSYFVYADLFDGEWQNGLRLLFRDKFLFDVEKFDNTLFEREDIKWIKSSYLIVLQMAWDREFLDRTTGKYTFPAELKSWNDQFNNIDVFGIWPTWPRLGLDQRNQWDMYRNLPGGTEQLKSFARMTRQYGTRFFIAYNPWDNSTRIENHYKGMARLISETEADGVVLDTRGSSSYELQAAADSVRRGVVMFSEGMAIPRDMPGIIAGRVHNAIYYSPELNLNKLIKPDFAIFRVCDVGEDNNHREIAISFFNGYGTELNLFRPGGRDDGYRNDLDYLAQTTFILRQNNDAFLDYGWTPLINTESDNIFVNSWKSGEKTIFTVLNMKPEGFSGNAFKTDIPEGRHLVSLWHHEILHPEKSGELYHIRTYTQGWPVSSSGTRLEGSVDCIGMFPELIKAEIIDYSLMINRPGRGRLLIYKGNPSYQNKPTELKNKNDTTIKINDLFGYFEGKIVIQYLEDNLLRDEKVLYARGGKPWLISSPERTDPEVTIPTGMVLVPKAEITYTLTTREDFIPYPDVNKPVTALIDSFLIDRYPVTNEQYYEFITRSNYYPSDTTNYLHHWESGIYRQGQENYPVVWVNSEDMAAYCRWAGKRLPTEAEWQLAAQGTDKRIWPWGNEFHATRCNNSFGRPTPVDAFTKGASPFGVSDLVGNIWQATADTYFNGSYYFTVIRGGSYYKPDSSWWYIEGGPQPLDHTQIMLLESQGSDRASTVGFRCVKDVVPGSIVQKEKRD